MIGWAQLGCSTVFLSLLAAVEAGFESPNLAVEVASRARQIIFFIHYLQSLRGRRIAGLWLFCGRAARCEHAVVVSLSASLSRDPPVFSEPIRLDPIQTTPTVERVHPSILPSWILLLFYIFIDTKPLIHPISYLYIYARVHTPILYNISLRDIMFLSSLISYLFPSSVSRSASPSVDLPPFEPRDLERVHDPASRRAHQFLKLIHLSDALVPKKQYSDSRDRVFFLSQLVVSVYILGASAEYITKLCDAHQGARQQWESTPAEVTKADWRDFLGNPASVSTS